MFIAFSCLTSIINTLGKSEYVYPFLLKKNAFFQWLSWKSIRLDQRVVV